MEAGTVDKYLGATGMEITSEHGDDLCMEKVAETLGGWDSTFLSCESRHTLLQLVPQAQATFYVSLMCFSAKACKKIEQLCGHFLWGYNKEGSAKIALVKWEFVCRPKSKGGLGINHLVDCNTSLM